MSGWHHDNADWQEKICRNCGGPFVPASGCQVFCSDGCRHEHPSYEQRLSTEAQYKSISGNWQRYFNRLAGKKHREGVTVDQLLLLLAQQGGKCALSGVKLTCLLEKGKKFKTNASLDRIEAGGPYIIENIQLVCSALNSWRGDTELDEFKWWCKQVTQHQEEVSP